MHSSETLPAPPAGGPNLLLQLGRLIVRARSSSPSSRATPSPRDRLLHAKLLAAKPSTSQQVQTQPKPEPGEPKHGVEAQLSDHVNALWNEHIPVCIEVLLAPECSECYSKLSRLEGEASYDKLHTQQKALLLERWTMRALVTKPHESPAFITSQWLLNAVRSQLHFSQLSAWLATLKRANNDNPGERRRKLSREKCNFKKLEANCDENDTANDERKLNIVYSIKIPGESYKMAEFVKPPTDHTFPVTDIGNNVFLKVVLESLPRIDDIPTVLCTCQKRRPSKEIPANIHEELAGKLNDLTIGPRNNFTDPINTNISSRRLSIISNSFNDDNNTDSLVDDRMHTPCSESGKHKCNCDDESDGKENQRNLPKKLDERRIKEIAKYKRRLRKENKLKLCDSSSSEDGKVKETTSIPILQASRFDRFRAIGCYRNQTYLTLPASRIESKSPFIDSPETVPPEIKKTNTVGTQTDDPYCECGNAVTLKCDDCSMKMVRSEGNYNLALYNTDNGTRRKCEDDVKSFKKLKCDNISDNSYSDIIKRPKLRRFFPINERVDKIVRDRCNKDIEELHLKNDDTVLLDPEDIKRQKTHAKEVFRDVDDKQGFRFPDVKKIEAQIPSASEMDRFRWRFESAASMVFHTKTGLPLTSSPAPLRRGKNCFDFDDSIKGISGIKSALFHPVPRPAAPPSPASPASPSPSPSPSPTLTPTPKVRPTVKREVSAPKLRVGSSSGLLGSFEESALKGRLEPVATVHGFTAEIGASGAFCPPHKRLPVTVFFYAPGGTNAPYMGHIDLGPGGYRVARSGTVQVSLFNPHGTLVKMFVVLYELAGMPAASRTFLRQRTLALPAGVARPPPHYQQWLRYLIHLRFMTSKSGKLYLHTDIRIIVSRKADLDTATAHSAIFRPIPTNHEQDKPSTNRNDKKSSNQETAGNSNSANHTPNRVFGGCSDFDSELQGDLKEICYENQNGVSYELRSFTYAPDNPRYSPR